MEKIRLLLADDHPSFREGLERLLREEEDVEVVGQSSDGQEAVNMSRELHPDVVILDVSMPKLNGVEATKQIKESCPDTAILILSAYDNNPYVLSAIEYGADGYLLKSARYQEVITAIRAVRGGGKVLDSAVANKVFSQLSGGKFEKDALKSPQQLHPRELEVLKVAARGLSNKEIAQELSISVFTVQTHMVNILQKLEANSRTEAVLRALKEGWLTMDDLP
jgi:NarL family two-component system response regulator LiaR